MKNRFLLILILATLVGFVSCTKDDDEEKGTNKAPKIDLAENIEFDLKNKPTANDVKQIILEAVTDDFTKKENFTITTAPKLEDINFTEVSKIEIKGTIFDDGTSPSGEIEEIKSTAFSVDLLITQIEEGEIVVKSTMNALQKWLYFSFEKKEQVGESDADKIMDGLDWDMAFHFYDVRLNGGESGTGQGAALLIEGAKGKDGWNSVVKAPDSGYQTDKKDTIITSAMPTVKIEVPRSTVITGGMDALGEKKGTWTHSEGMPPTFESTNQIFVIRTANGNYCKIWLKKYSYITGTKMKYLIQKNKYSRTLK